MSSTPNRTLRDETILPLETAYKEELDERIERAVHSIKDERSFASRRELRQILEWAYDEGWRHGYTIGVSRNEKGEQ